MVAGGHHNNGGERERERERERWEDERGRRERERGRAAVSINVEKLTPCQEEDLQQLGYLNSKGSSRGTQLQLC